LGLNVSSPAEYRSSISHNSASAWSNARPVVSPEAVQVGRSTYILLVMMIKTNQLQALPQKLIRRQNHHHCSIDVTQSQLFIFGICQRSKAI
jgi:hypothetical protein